MVLGSLGLKYIKIKNLNTVSNQPKLKHPDRNIFR